MIQKRATIAALLGCWLALLAGGVAAQPANEPAPSPPAENQPAAVSDAPAEAPADLSPAAKAAPDAPPKPADQSAEQPAEESAEGPGDQPAEQPVPLAPEKPVGDEPPAVKISLAQEQIAERYRRLEELMLRMAELTAAEDPARAALLKQAVAKSKERLVGVQFERLVEFLSKDRLSNAVAGQTEVIEDLKTLMTLLLSEDRADRLKSEQERIKAYLKEVNKLIKEQQGIQAQTGRQGPSDGLAQRQGQLTERAGKLGQQMSDEEAKARGESSDEKDADDEAEKSDAQSADGQPPSDKDGEPSDNPAGDGKPSESGEKAVEAAEDKSAQEKASEKGDGKKSEPSDEGSPEKESGDQEPSKNDAPSSGEPAPGDKPSGESQPSEGDSSKPSEGESPGQPGQSGGPSTPGGDKSESESPPPGEQPQSDAQKRVAVAQQRMKDAQEKLEKALKEEAVEKQEEAIRELEAAKAELEKILRQMREEEMARILAFLEARFRKMLEMQIEVHEGTVRLDHLPADARGRGSEIEAGRLGRTESNIVIEADKALALLREEGSAVAMPEALEQTRDDMQQVVRKLADADVGAITQGLEEDIIAGLEEMIAALAKAQEDLEKQQNQQQPPQPQQPGEPQEPPLVDQLAELRMIRSLQMRVNRRTQTYSKLIDGEQADRPELLEALEELAQRQERIYRTTRDIVVGKNE